METPLHTTVELECKRLTTPSAGEDEDQMELSFVVAARSNGTILLENTSAVFVVKHIL
jgi:hypothetical protein